MTKPRIIETDEGIQDPFEVETYDVAMRRMRDRGWIRTKSIVKSGIKTGKVLEIGPGPGYAGLEWLSSTPGTSLVGAEISANMIKMARKNAAEYGISDRTEYVLCDARELPFEDASFGGVFSNGSFHEWAEPEKIMAEIHRVLKAEGRYWIGDLKRNMSWIIRKFLIAMTKPKSLVPGLISSINAAYTPDEAEELLNRTPLRDAAVGIDPFGLEITGVKS